MRVATSVASAFVASLLAVGSSSAAVVQPRKNTPSIISPRMVIISMFVSERDVWLEPLGLKNNVTIPGLSPLFPSVLCDGDYTICQMTTGEAEINAAASVMAMILSPKFDFKSTYFMVAGIAGINPHMGTLGTATFVDFAVQNALQYQVDAREMPSNWSTGYYAQGTNEPGVYPSEIYGTEVFQINTNLLAKALEITKGVTLNDSADAQAYRSMYDYAPANEPPKIISCTTATSDVYWYGDLLGESFGNYTTLLTKGQGKYCTTQQEDNATLEVMVRLTKAGLMDFSRVLLLRTASDIDREPPTQSATVSFQAAQGGFGISITNLYTAGWPVVKEIVSNWSEWSGGVPVQSNTSMYGDIFGTLTTGVVPL